MFFLRIIQYLMGYVRFCAEGASPERFLNLAAKEGAMLWNIRRKGTCIYANVLTRRFKKLAAQAKRAGICLEAASYHGLPYHIRRYSARKGILAGFLLFIAALAFFSSFIWEVDISGNKTVPESRISQTLADLGLAPGSFPLFVNVRQVERETLLKLPDLSGITINMKGSKAEVEVRERRYPPDVVPEGQPCNVKASQTGQILDIEAYEGKPMVRKGDTIRQGEILISGVIVGKAGEVRIVHASGKAVAKTRRSLETTVPFQQREKRETGKQSKRYTVGFFNISIPLYFRAPAGNCNTYIYTSSLNLLGQNLPFSFTTRVYRPTVSTVVTLSKDQAAKLAQKKLADKEKVELSGIKILSRTMENRSDKAGYTLVCNYECEENIAFQEAIQIS